MIRKAFMMSILDDYEKDPADASAIVRTAIKLAADNKHETCMLMLEQIWDQDLPSDLRRRVLYEAGIHGYYSKIPHRNVMGRDACEMLSMDRSVPAGSRWTAMQNSTWYSQNSRDLFPSTITQPVDFVQPDDYKSTNPSIVSWRGQLWMIQRTVNYIITPSGHYDMRGDKSIRTRNYLIRLAEDLSTIRANEIFLPPDLPEPSYDLVLGFEDCRLFVWNDELWCTSTVKQLNQHGYCQIILAKITPEESGDYRFSDHRVIHPLDVPLAHQKNWMPLVKDGNLYFIYGSDPIRIIDDRGRTAVLNHSSIASDSFRGGSQALPFDGGWLTIIHQSVNLQDNRRRYLHRFVKYASDMSIESYTNSFHLERPTIEFAAGLAEHPTSGDLIVSFGVDDRESWLATFNPDEIRTALRKAPPVSFNVSQADAAWIQAQTNTALKDKLSVDRATSIISQLSLKQHEDAVKNWDNLQSLWHTINTVSKDEWVMDVAATPGSAYLPSLHRYGYRNLISINLTDRDPVVIDGVIYQYGDCTGTDFPDDHFGFISCLSVVEHGVDTDMFLKESARILKPGGHLFVSTDYWEDTVDTRGQMAFGVPVKVFTPDQITEMIETGKKYKLEITSEVDLNCKDHVVNWIGMDYTFVSLLFKKVV
jgi:SAM-dependent methyltransferase